MLTGSSCSGTTICMKWGTCLTSSQDVHTSRWVVEKCLQGDLVKGRTVLMVVSTNLYPEFDEPDIALQSHNLALTAPLADFMVSMGPNGLIQAKGSPAEVLGSDPALTQAFELEKEAVELDQHEEEEHDKFSTTDAKGGKLIVDEEVEVGNVGRRACQFFLQIYIRVYH